MSGVQVENIENDFASSESQQSLNHETQNNRRRLTMISPFDYFRRRTVFYHHDSRYRDQQSSKNDNMLEINRFKSFENFPSFLKKHVTVHRLVNAGKTVKTWKFDVFLLISTFF